MMAKLRTNISVRACFLAVIISGCHSNRAVSPRELVVSSTPQPSRDPILFDLRDPEGDDNGPGSYIYPEDPAFAPSSFDLTAFSVARYQDRTELRVRFASSIRDPWNSVVWGGHGFSLQMIFIHIDAFPSRGFIEGLPGSRIRFRPEEAWDFVVILSPLGPERLAAHIATQASKYQKSIILPNIVRVDGDTLIASVKSSDLKFHSTWGYQVLAHSYEPYPTASSLLVRKINEFKGQHSFGGRLGRGNGPNVLDLFVPPARGTQKEIQRQHEFLSDFDRHASKVKTTTWAYIPMIYPQKLTLETDKPR